MSSPTLRPMRVAVVTPYSYEPDTWLRTVMDSVAAQSHEARHIMVGDGRSAEAVERAPGVTGLSLPAPSRDSGSTPRQRGAAFAIEQGAEMVIYADADDRLHPDFVAWMVGTHQVSGAQVMMPGHRCTDPELNPVATPDGRNAVIRTSWSQPRLGSEHEKLFLSAAGLTLAGDALKDNELWTQIPKSVARVHDVLFSQALLSRPYRVVWMLGGMYDYRWTSAANYRRYGLKPPPALRDMPGARAKLDSINAAADILNDPAQRAPIEAALGIDPDRLPEDQEFRTARDHAQSENQAVLRDAHGRFGTTPLAKVEWRAAR